MNFIGLHIGDVL